MVQGKLVKQIVKDCKETYLYIGGFELPDKNAAAHRVISVAKIFRELGKEVVFVGVRKDGEKGLPFLSTKTEIYGFRAYSQVYPGNYRMWFRYITSIKHYIEVVEASGGVSGIICYNFPAAGLEKIRRYCKKNGIRSYADITEWYSVSGRPFAERLIKGMDIFFAMRVVHKRMDGLLVISRYLEHYYRHHNNVVCIPPLVDLSEEKWKNTSEKSLDLLKLVYAGSPGKKDRIDILLEALRGLRRRYRLDVAGITEAEYLVSHPEQAEWIQTNENIIFHGRLSHWETLTLIKKANYSCFFRDVSRLTTAGFPTKLVEAVSCRTPVLTNRTSDIGEYLRDGKNGILIKEASTEEISEALNHAAYKMDVEPERFYYLNYIPVIKTLIGDSRF